MTIHRYALAVASALLLAAQPAGADTLAQRWDALRARQPQLQARDAARALNVSETELLASGAGQNVIRLKIDDNAAREIMRRALDFGKVQALTGNANGTLERTGVATRLEQDMAAAPGPNDTDRDAQMRNIAGGYLGGDIDLRFNFGNWKYAFAVVQPDGAGWLSRSLQFFDPSGNAVHKLFLKNEAAAGVFDKLVEDFRAPDQNAALKIDAAPPREAVKPDASVDVKGFQKAWRDMSDASQFNRLLGEYGVEREQAMRFAPAGAVQRVTPQAVKQLLDDASARKLPIIAFMGNEAVTQSYTGTIARTAASGEWYKALAPGLDLQLRVGALTGGYVVQRAGVTSVEFFDKDGELVVSFFGVRERGKQQPQGWIELTRALPKA
jgi:putative hemin transport protein